MKTLGPERIERGEIEILQHVEQDQGGEPLAARRQLEDVEAAIVGGDRLDHIAAMAGQIVCAEKRAARLDGRHDVLGDGPFIEGARTPRGDLLQRCRQGRQADHVAERRRASVRKIVAGGAWIAAQALGFERPIVGDTGSNGKTVFGVTDRRRQGAIEPEAAVRLEDRRPRFDRPRNRHGVHGIAGEITRLIAGQRLHSECAGGAPGAVVAPDRRVRLGNDAEAVAADAGHVRLDDAEHRNGGDGCVRCGAARAQRLDGGLRCQLMRRRRHCVARDGRRAAGQVEIACHVPIAMEWDMQAPRFGSS